MVLAEPTAALNGQGVALVGETVERGQLIESFGAAGRVASPDACWLVRWPLRRETPALAAFENWLQCLSGRTRSQLSKTARQNHTDHAIQRSQPAARRLTRLR